MKDVLRLELPVLPLRNTVILPHTTTGVDVGRPKSKRAVEEALNADRYIFLVTQKDPEVDDPTPEDLFGVGTLAVVKQAMRLPDGTLQVMVEARNRARLVSYVAAPYLRAVGEVLSEPPLQDPSLARVLVNEVQEAFERYLQNHKTLRLDRYQQEAVKSTLDPAILADLVTHHATWNLEEKQEILETPEVEERLKKVLALLLRDLERFELDKKIATRVKEQMDQNQREYYLREQMKAIQKELGGGEDFLSEIEELRERIEKKGMPEGVKEKALKELKRLERMQPGSPEATVSRTYLDWLLEVPWTEADSEVLDIAVTKRVLDEDHYGLKDVKERILEYLAVRQLTKEKEVKGHAPILCFVGPPGVGKTSLGKSIARSMNRKFHRISLGGVRDEAEIRGHRRTYIGALPGKIIQGMKQVGVVNPVFLLDEIDKLSSDWRGDPASALLEVLDPEQNHTFTDHYLDVPYDLSRVFFITTANTLSTIPKPLLDRMEVIEIPGYTLPEKRAIARHFRWPFQVKEAGLEGKLEITDRAIERIVQEYTREAGVRNLDRELSKVARKAAKDYLESPWEGVRVVDAQDLEAYLGVPKYRPDRAEKAPQVGVAQGLAWTPYGGALLTIEAVAVPGTGKVNLTGNLGEVMKESAHAALTYLRAHREEWGLPEGFHKEYDLHIHVPEGATPKDGPSAGITMATALASALTGRPVRMDIAMTGEITLRGKVLAIGGVKEKLLAAHQAGIFRVVLPKENEPELKEVPEEILKDLEITFVEEVGEVLRLLLLPPSPPPVAPTERPQPGAGA
ncbi:endopeptidase La [Thermus scotoductus]|uniref:Lon protease n=1 Tax=Thermus scotoductus TaxID=37636 RepID=A0A430R8S9_THESC|nr:endopeptidase La [Thermus scotoductus]RTG96915.1 endopeptidase La [Thermus scotoductus]RTH03799.1 endopeptidase La [Thermus scotoductus]RTH22659.1 endopeptidase La [Thermus scotoductus]RTI01117.1 endopeptidase La [Thermus scotoductus]RTI23648.1 endopeptidase La [Thermus scotoductus]